MSELTYIRARTLSEAVELLNQPGLHSLPLAGGTDLMIQFRRGQLSCDRLVDLTHIPELKKVEIQEGSQGTVLLGAAVTIAEILENLAVVAKLPLLAQACMQFGGPQIRNLATMGGNVINRAACADLLPVLVCLDAMAYVVSIQGEYCLPVSELISHPFPAGNVVRAFFMHLPPESSKSVFLRLARRNTLATARLSLALLGSCKPDGAIEEARLVPGAVFARVNRIPAVEDMLVGQFPSTELYQAAGQKMRELFLAESGGRWSAPYKQVVISNLTERGLRTIYGN